MYFRSRWLCHWLVLISQTDVSEMIKKSHILAFAQATELHIPGIKVSFNKICTMIALV